MAPIEGKNTVDLFKRMSDLFATLYDYEEALVRQNQKKEDVDKIREIIEKVILLFQSVFMINRYCQI